MAEAPSYNRGSSYVDLRAFVEECVSATERLRRVFLVCGRWGSAAARFEAERTLLRLAGENNRANGQYTFWIALQRIPASLCFYWYCAGALAAGDYATVKRVFDLMLVEAREQNTLLEFCRPPPTLMSAIGGSSIPTSSSEDGGRLFDDLEALIAMEFGYRRILVASADDFPRFWVPLGRFRFAYQTRIAPFAALPESSPYPKAGFFGGKASAAAEVVTAMRQQFSGEFG